MKLKSVQRLPRTRSESAVCPIDPARDMPAIVDLIAEGFREELDPQGLKYLQQMREQIRNGTENLGMSGFVWRQSGQVIANLSLRRDAVQHHGWLIGNVVVHPDYRGQGIGRALMEAALAKVRAHHGEWIGLEVRDNNAAAQHLYEALGFRSVGQTWHLLRAGDRPWPALTAPRGSWQASRPRDTDVWEALIQSILTPEQQWVLEMHPTHYAYGSWERAFNLWFSGQCEHAWLGMKPAKLALRVKTDRRHHYHVWDMWIHPENLEQGIAEVLAKAMWATRHAGSWPVVAMIAPQAPLLQACQALGFCLHRTLIQMLLPLL